MNDHDSADMLVLHVLGEINELSNRDIQMSNTMFV
jgi:hypothetical protein